MTESEAGVTRTLTPMTKEQWDKKQSEVRRVYDPETGRHRQVVCLSRIARTGCDHATINLFIEGAIQVLRNAFFLEN